MRVRTPKPVPPMAVRAGPGSCSITSIGGAVVLRAKDAAGGMRSFNRIKQPWAAPRRGRFVQNPYYVRG